jgi:parallel beta-helix repeat protein
MTRGTWPLLSDCRIWGNANVGIRIDGDFDGTVEGNTVELNAADGITISLEAGGESYVWINYCIAGVSM